MPPAGDSPSAIAPPLLAWFDHHGRRDLPWQAPTSPYRVWVSEVMLQQTQVATVIPYFTRFMARFPTIEALARATADDVLHHWSGLGYYARGRNLHRAARILAREHGGRLPEDPEALAALPGIGRSTAGAILALAWERREPILDGNVKRVLARYHGVRGWTGQAAVQRELWALADHHTPFQRVAHYTQAIMDLGATVCTRRRPRCGECPLRSGCHAHNHDETHLLPSPRPKRVIPIRQATFLIIENRAREVLLEQRPPTGVWGGLWCPPQCAAGTDPADWVERHLGGLPRAMTRWPVVTHVFTHFRLEIQPVHLQVDSPRGRVLDGDRMLWYNTHPANQPVGIAAPVARLLARLLSEEPPSDP